MNDMMYIGDACGRIDLLEDAEKQYKRILEEKKDDKNFPAAQVRVRSQLGGLLRQKAKALMLDAKSKEADATFKNALDEIDKLIGLKPKALEPKMERGRILRDWSNIDPSKFQEAVSHWTRLRTQLANSTGKKPPEYFEVVYNAAECLYTASQKLANKGREAKRPRLTG